MELVKIIDKGKLEQQISNETQEIFENLEEGIVVLKNNTIDFGNKVFHNILNNIGAIESTHSQIHDQILDYQIFQLFRCDEVT